MTQERDLDEFLNTAQLAATDFTAGACLLHSYLLKKFIPSSSLLLIYSIYPFLPIPEKQNVRIISAPGIGSSTAANPFLLSDIDEKATLSKHAAHKKSLRVPRRPGWTKSMTAAQVDKQEKAAFLEWRRGLAQCVLLFFFDRCFTFKGEGRGRLMVIFG